MWREVPGEKSLNLWPFAELGMKHLKSLLEENGYHVNLVKSQKDKNRGVEEEDKVYEPQVSSRTLWVWMSRSDEYSQSTTSEQPL